MTVWSLVAVYVSWSKKTFNHRVINLLVIGALTSAKVQCRQHRQHHSGAVCTLFSPRMRKPPFHSNVSPRVFPLPLPAADFFFIVVGTIMWFVYLPQVKDKLIAYCEDPNNETVCIGHSLSDLTSVRGTLWVSDTERSPESRMRRPLLVPGRLHKLLCSSLPSRMFWRTFSGYVQHTTTHRPCGRRDGTSTRARSHVHFPSC